MAKTRRRAGIAKPHVLCLGDRECELAFEVEATAWAPDGERLLLCGMLYDVENCPYHGEPVPETWLVSADAERLPAPPERGRRGAWSPNGARLALAPPLRLRGESGVRAGPEAGGRCLAWSPDGRWIAADREGAVVLWDGEVARELPVDSPLVGLAWSPRALATRHRDGGVRFWRGGALAARVDLGGGGPMRWSPDGGRLALTIQGGVALLDPAGARVGAIRGHTSTVRSLAWSPDGARLATSAHDRTLRVWAVETNQELLRLTRRDCDQARLLAWSRGGRLAAVCAGPGKYEDLYIWAIP